MKKITPREYNQSIVRMARDLIILNRARLELQGDKIHPDTLNGLQSMFPIKEEMPFDKMVERWNTQIEAKILEIEDLKVRTHKHLEKMRGNAFRCALPKKQQRKIGLLPEI